MNRLPMIAESPHHILIADKNFIPELKRELVGVAFEKEGLVVAQGGAQEAAWALDVWGKTYEIRFESISEAARELRQLGKFWAFYPVSNHRRAALIQDELRKVKIPERLNFPHVPDVPEVGGWALIDRNTILAAPKRWKKIPHGRMEFEENKAFPPNRAYLKLWEAFTLMRDRPKADELCLDLGSSPGGWTWVLQSLGARVVSVDKADLAPRIAKLPRVTHLKESAFGLDPKRFGDVDWLCSDVICYPERLYRLVERWLDSGTCRNFVCTVKLQGETDFEWIARFKAIPDSQLIHLYHNKHELTWIYPARAALFRPV